MRDFARANGRLAKTDQVDARVILHFAGAMRPAQIPHIDDGRIALAALFSRRRQLVDMAAAPQAVAALIGKTLAALIGVAPTAQDSGTWRGQRHIAGGSATVRFALYSATLSAIRCSPAIKAFHKRLRDAGKPPKVAIVAAMRKFIIMINTILKRRTPWSEPHQYGCSGALQARLEGRGRSTDVE